MSTNADCQFIEKKPNEWYYRLQQWPYGETPDYNEFGPFSTKDAAYEHLRRNHANPGGHSVTYYADVQEQERDNQSRCPL